MNAIGLYFRYLQTCLRAQMLYPTAFSLRLASQFLITITEFFGIYALFARFGHIRGWSFAQIALFYGVVSASFALADTVCRGFDMFGPQFVKTGDFDRILLRPRAATLQLMGFEFGFTSLGRLAQGMIAIVVALILLKVGWTTAKLALLFWAVMGGFALFFAILLLQATLAFWTVESLELVNTITYGGIEAAQYPLDIYAKWFRNFLIFVVPLGCVVYFPVASALGHSEVTGLPSWAGVISPLAGFAFLGLAFLAWDRGVRRYTSTGS